MPIYEYRCGNCEHEFEVIQKINDDPIKICPECSAKQVERLISAAGFQLKGTGWYVTDFKNQDKSKPKTNTPAKPVTKDSSSESKPAKEAATPKTSTSGEKN